MKRTLLQAGGTFLVALLLVAAGRAQSYPSQTPSTPQAPSQTPPAQAPGGLPPAGQIPGTPATPAVDPAEAAAFTAFMAAHGPDPTAQIKLGEDFVKMYPSSTHLTTVYSTLALDYLTANDNDKLIAAAQKAIDADPDNVAALSLLVWAMSRTVDADSPGAAAEFVKLQNYGHHAIELVATMPKPAGLDDAAFTAAKNDNLSMCHSGLGLIDLKLGRAQDAVDELKQSVALSASPDPVDLFVLGHAYEAVGQFDDAVDAFSRCAAEGPMQDRCKAGIDDAKQQKLTAPAAAPPKS
jgi:tetratricopeptide (TPR) repeat protein